MNLLYSFTFVIVTLYANVSTSSDSEIYFTLQGQVIYLGGLQTSIEPDSRLIVELQDISITDNLATTIAQQISSAIVFPLVFNISYSANQIIHQHLHVINAKIFNNNNKLLFLNEQHIEVRLLGLGRTTFIDVLVVQFNRMKQIYLSDSVYVSSKLEQDYITKIKRQTWPQLVGQAGDHAVDVIKKETGFSEVFIVTNSTCVSKDLRYDRVCLYVDDNGKVARVPTPG